MTYAERNEPEAEAAMAVAVPATSRVVLADIRPARLPARLPTGTPETTSLAEVPRLVWRAFIGTWLVFLATLWLAFGGTTHSAFMIAISTFLALAYFVLPPVLVRLNAAAPKCSAPAEVDTLTGPISAGAAAVQILLIPVTLTGGMIAMAVLAL